MSLENELETNTTEKVLETESVIATYNIVAEWIRFADAKAAVTLTVNGVLIGVLLPTLKAYLADPVAHPTAWWKWLVIVFFAGWLITLSVSAIYAFLCILPFRGLGRKIALAQTAHFHPAAVATKFKLDDWSKYVADCEKLSTVGLKREVLVALLIDAHLSNAKYHYVTRAIQWLAGSVLCALVYLLTIQVEAGWLMQ
jgi:hypothetical protein